MNSSSSVRPSVPSPFRASSRVRREIGKDHSINYATAVRKPRCAYENRPTSQRGRGRILNRCIKITFQKKIPNCIIWQCNGPKAKFCDVIHSYRIWTIEYFILKIYEWYEIVSLIFQLNFLVHLGFSNKSCNALRV